MVRDVIVMDSYDTSTLRKLRTPPKLLTYVLTFLGFPQYHRATAFRATRNIVVFFIGNDIFDMLHMFTICFE